jgi:hypothetical protein
MIKRKTGILRANIMNFRPVKMPVYLRLLIAFLKKATCSAVLISFSNKNTDLIQSFQGFLLKGPFMENPLI